MTVYSQIKTNRRYLYGARFVVIVDHELLVTLYKGKGKNLPVRVAKHMSKLRGFNFTVTYEPGKTTPCDYDSLHPPQSRSYSKPEKEEYGVENEEDDCEIIFNRVEHGYMPDDVTLPVLRQFTKENLTLSQLGEDVQQGRLRTGLTNTKYKQVFQEMSWVDGVLLRGDRLVIPNKLKANILALAHEGHPGRPAMLQQGQV